ncbi:4-hydroxybenzoate 3-monooxygenase [Streptomyces sp. DSM 44938]|uniref:4-hydroxybenzoate 3-monooxygenase n=1 Tax=Streptomyces litchfieldiae TaxID=3075543 RepID=A0ABU2MJG1_9ACTN|nr:4-hydroxybenzoate 3-monooxygenase [Streptomyces sp. DSM 44938]MDT0341078.1 4-hydroxybenzoate 3-monooxygenase [Streptomyces sp. DSM 44938]
MVSPLEIERAVAAHPAVLDVQVVAAPDGTRSDVPVARVVTGGAVTEPGAPLLFEAEVHAVEGADTARPTVRFTHEGREKTLSCDFVVGCDGFHGVVRTCVPASVARTYDRIHPSSWLGILVNVPPSGHELIYAHSPRGFALHSMRPPTVTRLYLQVPNGTRAEDWPDDRIWDELDERFAVDADWKLQRGPITAKNVVPLRSSVFEPMRHGNVFLAGDAAHIVPPTGAKGLNLAFADVAVLARAFAHLNSTGSADLLDQYSDTCLRRVWQTEHFSWYMTSLLHADPEQPFEPRLQLAQLHRIASSSALATELADNYTGLPIA